MRLHKKLGIALCTALALSGGISSIHTEAAGNMTVVDKNADDGSFTVTLKKNSTAAKYKKIYLDVWSEVNGKDDLKTASVSSSKSKWTFTVKAENHNYDEGTYCLRAYGIKNGKKVELGYTTYDVAVDSVMNMSLSVNKEQTKVQATVKNARFGNDMLRGMKLCVWTYANGKDDVQVYDMKKQSGGTYTYDIPISKHNYEAGTYCVEAYADFTEGELERVYYKKASIEGISDAKVSTQITDNDMGVWTVQAKGMTGPAAIKKVQTKVWYTNDGPDTAQWFEAVYDKKTKAYKATVPSLNYGLKSGNYTVEVYATDARGVCELVGTKQQSVTPNITKNMAFATAQVDGGYAAAVAGLGCINKIQGVVFNVWDKTLGEATATSYLGEYNAANNMYAVTIPSASFNHSGEYEIEAYLVINNVPIKLAQGDIDVTTMSSEGCTTRYVNNETGSFQMVANKINSSASITKVEFIVTPGNDSSAARIYQGRKIGDKWYAEAGAAQFGCKTGQYTIEVQATDSRGAVQVVDKTTVNVQVSDRYKSLYGNTAQMKGIDISKWQASPQKDGSYKTTIDWNKVKNDGIDFVMIRVGYRGSENGQIYADPTFDDHIQGALNAGLNVGVYFFSQAVTEAEAKEEVAWTYDKIKEYRLDFPICIDSEAVYTSSGAPGRGNKMSRATRTSVTAAFCDAVKSYGYTPLIYASSSWLDNQLDMSKLSDYDVWVAQYGANNGSDSHKVTYGGKYTVWQYTSTAKINGISGNVDKNNGYKLYSAGDGNGKAYSK